MTEPVSVLDQVEEKPSSSHELIFWWEKKRWWYNVLEGMTGLFSRTWHKWSTSKAFH